MELLNVDKKEKELLNVDEKEKELMERKINKRLGKKKKNVCGILSFMYLS